LWLLFVFDRGLRALGLGLRIRWLALHNERHRPDHGLILAIGDVISHGLLHEVPSFFGSRND
jgi:hypothetical protein